MNWLTGKKTYIGAIAGGVIIIASTLGWIDETTTGVLLGLVATWTGVSMRNAIGRGK